VALENVEQIARIHPHDLVGQIADISLFVVLLVPILQHILQHGIILIHKWLWFVGYYSKKSRIFAVAYLGEITP
jgi:hypothetical protein